MAFVVVAIWKAKPGEEGRIREIIGIMTRLSRQEAGNIHYQAQVSLQDPTRFLLYEQYTSAKAYDDHKASEHFRKHVFGHAIHHLESREVSTYETIDV